MVTVENTLRKQYPKFFNFPTYVHKPTVGILKYLFHEKGINDFLEKSSETGLAFVDSIMDYLNISYTVDSKKMKNIPALGKVIIVANHPLGAIDGLALVQMISSVRSDKKVKIVANNMLSSVSQFKDIFIPVDNFNGKLSKNSLNRIDQALNNEEAVIFFPSGEVSRAYFNGIRDSKWKSGFAKFAKRTQSPILPIYIKAKNSKLFYGASWIYRPLGTMLLSHEMFKARDSVLEFNVGEQVSSQTLSGMQLSYKAHAKLFRKHLYRLARGKKGIYATEQCIAHPESRQDIKKELKEAERLGTTSDDKHIYLVDHEISPTIMNEIGRLREYSFRKVGEGSGRYKDLDRYDQYYQHLVLWDEEALEVVGAYRIGECECVLPWMGKEGLYMNELCKIDEDIEETLYEAIELGRSFVQPKYWGTRALDYLWQGIGAYLSHNPQIKYMYGPVSISGAYPQHAKEALVYFYKHYFGAEKSSFTARQPYRLSTYTIEEMQKMFKGDDYRADFKTLREYLREFNVTVPTLYKQYSDVCEEGGVEFMDFGIDREFNDCIDGYIMVDIRKLKPAKRQRYITNSI